MEIDGSTVQEHGWIQTGKKQTGRVVVGGCGVDPRSVVGVAAHAPLHG